MRLALVFREPGREQQDFHSHSLSVRLVSSSAELERVQVKRAAQPGDTLGSSGARSGYDEVCDLFENAPFVMKVWIIHNKLMRVLV